MFYLFARRDLPGPGVQSYALLTYGTATQDASGGGKQYDGGLNPFGEQVNALQAGMIVGLGGQYQGVLAMQPLINVTQNGVSSQQYLTGAGAVSDGEYG